jgi:hypothetical protein
MIVPVFTPHTISTVVADAESDEAGAGLTVKLRGAEIQPAAFFTVTE